MIVITGANGFIGKELIKFLSEKKEKIRCLVIEGENTTELKHYGAEIIYGDILNKNAVTNLVKDSRYIVHLAAVVTSNNPGRLYKVNVEGTRNIVDACKENNIKRILFTSSIAAVAKHLGTYGKSKMEAEKIIEESGLDYTILRPTLVYGRKGPEFNDLVSLIKKLPIIPLIGGGKAKKHPVYLKDLAKLIVKILYSKKSIHKTYEIGGAEKVSFAALVDMICKEVGIKKIKLYIPSFVCLLASGVLEKLLENPPLTKDQILALENDAIADTRILNEDFDFKPVSLKKGLKKALGI